MTNNFSQAIQEKFMKDLENVNVAEDSDDESSLGDSFYESEKRKLQQALTKLKVKQNSNALQILKENTAFEDKEIEKYQQEIGDLQKLTRGNESNVLQESIIKEIKERVFNQSSVNLIQLADQVIQMKKKKEQAKEKEVHEFQKTSKIHIYKEDDESEKKLKKKIQRANEERQLVNMSRQDQLSMKNQINYLSQFFKDRFFTPQIKLPKQNNTPILIDFAAPKSTFTNLRPLANNEKNVLPKNAPEIALRNLKKGKKIKLIPSSISQMKVKIKKLNPQATEEYKQSSPKMEQDEEYCVNNWNKLKQSLSQYTKKVQPICKRLTKLNESYQPKFVNQFPSQNQQNCNIDFESGQTKTLGSCLEAEETDNLKDIKLTFEQITSLEGISQCKNVEHAALQFNNIKDIKGVQNCTKLVQLNINNNKIKNVESLAKLQWLRIVNIEHNHIESIEFYGGSLQFIYASHNRIQQIIDLSANPYLKKLLISHNNLHQLTGLKNLFLLQEINVCNNYINNLEGIQDCISLRLFDGSNNRITQLYPNFIAFFLNKLTLSSNSISDLPTMILPSLEELYLDRNKIQNQSNSVVYLPNLKILNLDFNKLSGFSTVWSFLRYSKKLQTLKYDGNQYFQDVREKVRQLYEHIIYRNMKNLKLLNQQSYDLGKKKYYQGVYNSYLASTHFFQPQTHQLQQIQQKINFLIKEKGALAKIQDKKMKFSFSEEFITHKSVKKSEYIREIVNFLKQCEQKQQNHTIFHGWMSIFYKHDIHQTKMYKSLHKINGIALRNKRYLQKKKQFYLTNRDNLFGLLQYINNFIYISRIKHAIQLFHKPLQGLSEQKAAIIIQKNWRCYRQRKRYLKVLQRLRKKDDDSDLEDIDLDEYNFDDMEIPEFEFEFPQDMDFDQYIIRPEVFNILKEKEEERTRKMEQKMPNRSGIRQQGNHEPMNNNFMQANQSAMTQRIDPHLKEEEQLNKLMKQWGINREAAKALRARNRQKQMKKKKEAQKNLSAAERYQRLKNGYR